MKTTRLVPSRFYLREILRYGREKLLPLSLRFTKPLDQVKKDSALRFGTPDHNDRSKSSSIQQLNPDLDDGSELNSQFIDWMKQEEKSSDQPVQAHQPSSNTNLPRLSRNSVEIKCRQLLRNLSEAKTPINQKIRLQELCKHLVHYPEACGFTLKEGGLPEVLRLLKRSHDKKVQAYAREALSLMGYSFPPKGQGIRILSIDGGGTKGIVVIEILREFERITGKPIHQLFDIICGVSTGAILAMLLGAFQTSIDDCMTLYKKTSQQMFQRDLLRGTSRLIWTHAYYDTSAWEKILRGVYSERPLIETAQNKDIPKIAAVSALMNTTTIQPFVFRNYNHADKSMSYFEGSCKYKIWQAIRASAAAPGFFEEFVLDNYVHQDGGVLMNNPTPVAIHEAQLLWPNSPIHVCVSIGSGRYSPMNLNLEEKTALTSLRTKISRFIDAATDTEGSHRLLQDLLKPGTYYRFNPTLTDHMSLDENRPEKLEQMQTDAQMYIRKNEYKLNKSAKALSAKRPTSQIIKDELRQRMKMYSIL